MLQRWKLAADRITLYDRHKGLQFCLLLFLKSLSSLVHWIKGVSSKEIVVLRRWKSITGQFGIVNWVDGVRLQTTQGILDKSQWRHSPGFLFSFLCQCIQLSGCCVFAVLLFYSKYMLPAVVVILYLSVGKFWMALIVTWSDISPDSKRKNIFCSLKNIGIELI